MARKNRKNKVTKNLNFENLISAKKFSLQLYHEKNVATKIKKNKQLYAKFSSINCKSSGQSIEVPLF